MGKAIAGRSRSGEKKLSWSYRNKKKQARHKNEVAGTNQNVQVQNRKGRIIVRNLSFKATEADVKKLFDPFGQIEEIDLLRRPDGKLVGCGFVQFKRVTDASKAIFNTNKKELLGRPISTSWAIPKAKYAEQINKKAEEQKSSDDTSLLAVDNESTNDDRDHRNEQESVEPNDNSEKSSDTKKKKNSDTKRVDRKVQKLMKKQKRAKIIVRNLDFQVTEDVLKEHFSQYGNTQEVKILTRPDGKPLGCGFVQFDLVQHAAKATHYANMQPLLGRPMVVDRALPKSKFEQTNKTNEVKTEVEEIEIKEENEDALDKQVTKNNDDVDHDDDLKEEEPGTTDEDSDESIKEEIQESDNENEDNGADQNGDLVQDEEPKRPRVISNDVSEGKTVFLKNVPFDVNNEELKECMEQYGPVYYALVCMDPLTEHSKGTAFVKFRNIEDAEKCLSAGTELRLHDQVLDPHKALNRNTVQETKGLNSQKIKDSRNLYLVKEGVILAGSPAAVGLTATDMAKRLQLEQWKSQMLRNLNMFVSRVRLVVHNLPARLDDSQLRQIFKKHAGPKAVIQEARVMRDLKNVDEKGVGKSKEFGFVAFTTHDDALKALRSINNNPNIFSKSKRPIVAFSIENRVMINAKKRRLVKSRERNPLWNREKDIRKKDEPPTKREKILSAPKEGDEPEYSGVKSKPGIQKMRSRFNLKTQAALHNKVRKTEKKQIKEAKKLQVKKRDVKVSRKEVKSKQGSKKLSADEANFSKLVNSYKTKLQSVPTTKSKWYDT